MTTRVAGMVEFCQCQWYGLVSVNGVVVGVNGVVL